jgi:hypothetical protein
MTTIKAGTTSTTAFMIEPDVTGELAFQAGNTTPMTIANTGVVSFANTATLKVPVGGLAERPNTSVAGMMRFNSDWNEFEGYGSGKWNQLTDGNLKLKLDFDETTSLDSRISFTRATNGTYFNSAGVLTTAGSGVARFDHRLENGTWVNKGLLIEEQRTNLVQRSEEFNDSYWTKNALTITTDNTTAPNGSTTADKIVETITNTEHRLQRNISVTSGTAYTLSVFAKKDERQVIKLEMSGGGWSSAPRVTFNLNTGTIQSIAGSPTSSNITSVGGGWYLCSVTASATSTTTGSIWFMFGNSDTGEAGPYAGTTGWGLFLWGAQLEAGAFPTSYIATTSASVTRNADQASMTSTNFSSWYNASEGTAFWQGNFIGVGNGTLAFGYSISDGNVNERIFMAARNASDLISTLVVNDNASQVVGLSSPDPRDTAVINQTYKTASTFKLNDFAHTLDGRTPATTNSGTLPTVNKISLGSNENNSSGFLGGHIAKFYYWNTRRPNEILQNLTE